MDAVKLIVVIAKYKKDISYKFSYEYTDSEFHDALKSGDLAPGRLIEFGTEFCVNEVGFYLVTKDQVLYIVYAGKCTPRDRTNKAEEVMTGVIVDVVEHVKKEYGSIPVICFFHINEFLPRMARLVVGARVYEFKEAGGIVTKLPYLTMKEIFDCIRGEENVKELNYTDFSEIYVAEILSSLLLLSLSIQAFFGISEDKSGAWIELSICEELSQEWKRAYPNEAAFLLVEEAKWDFYASVFDKVINAAEYERAPRHFNCDAEEQEYTVGNIADLLSELASMRIIGELEALRVAFGEKYGHERNEFVKYLREICAILANTRGDCPRGSKHYSYKGKCAVLRTQILNALGDDFKTAHCKTEKEGYEVLKSQVRSWGVEKARIVIGGIRKMASQMEEGGDIA